MQMNSGWYAVQVRSQSEKMVASLLKYKGYEVFLPTFSKGAAEKRNAEPKPLFPGYLFCCVGEQASGLIVTTPGVARILGPSGAPQPIPEAEIENLKQVVAAGVRVTRWPSFAAGAVARVTAGPLKGCAGVVVNADEVTHLVINVEMLRRSISVRVERDWVEALDPSPARPAKIAPASVRVSIAHPVPSFGAAVLLAAICPLSLPTIFAGGI